MSDVNWRDALPDVSFVDNRTVDEIMSAMIRDYQEEYTKQTGEACALSLADPERIKLYAAAQQLYQMQAYIDRAGKRNLLKYSYGGFLDNIAALKGVVRKSESYASTVLRFEMTAPRAEATGIPGGTRATASDNRYFATIEYVEIPAGEIAVEVQAECITPGTAGNGYGIGDIREIVDPTPYIASVVNTAASTGGADAEDDDSLAYRVYLAPAIYSVAGPSDAYKYHTLTARSDVGDVCVDSPDPTHARIVVLMRDGSMPDDAVLADIKAYLSGDTIRPLTDKVTVEAPVEVEYELALTYYIGKSSASRAETIQLAVSQAIGEYQVWQRSIGRDINPSELIRRVMTAGAKRVELLSPTFTVVEGDRVPRLTSATVVYGGLEDD